MRKGELSIGDALANAVTLIDGLVVIGGGLAAAAKRFMPKVVEKINGKLDVFNGSQIQRTELTAFNLENVEQMAAFIRGQAREIEVPNSKRKVVYDPLKRIGVGLSRLGTSRAVSIGASAFALHMLDAGSRQ